MYTICIHRYRSFLERNGGDGSHGEMDGLLTLPQLLARVVQARRSFLRPTATF